MGILVCGGATCSCTFGAAPSTLQVLSNNKSMSTMLFATIMDNKPMANIMPFGMCSSMSNPQVSSATAAALGVLTPQPCIPVTTAPWSPPVTDVLINGVPAFNNSAKLMCNWGGQISIVNPGQQKTQE